MRLWARASADYWRDWPDAPDETPGSVLLVAENAEPPLARGGNTRIIRLRQILDGIDPATAGELLAALSPIQPPTAPTPFRDTDDNRREGAAATVKPRFQPLEVFHDRLQDFGGTQGPAMARLPGGVFLMGGEQGNSDEQPVHPVKLDAFAIGQTPVTIGEYLAFCQATDSHWPAWLERGNQYHVLTGSDDYYRKHGIKPRKKSLADKIGWKRGHAEGYGQDPQCLVLPVVGVSWEDAAAYCQWLSASTGATYALPSEAQWEYACRAGNPGRWCFGDDEAQLRDYAWHAANAENKLHPVAGKKANAFGLRDMHGLVWEWCQDGYASDDYSPRAKALADAASVAGSAASNARNAGEEASQLASENPSGPASGSDRVLRGGSWSYAAGLCRSAYRLRLEPSIRGKHLGFRLSRTV